MGDYAKATLDLLKLQEPAGSYTTSLIDASRAGIARSQFMAFAQRVKQSMRSLSKVMPASYSSLSKKDMYDQDTSERILEIAEIYAMGMEVFGDIDRFNSWLQHVSAPLGGHTPFSLLDTSFGIRMLKDEIGRIDHGIFV